MTQPDWDEEFRNLADERYPGSRHTRRSLQETRRQAKAVADEGAWDAKPVFKVINGVRTELFSIGALADALGKAVVTVRLWERKGVIPKAQYRTPNKNGKGGRRLYTRAQIEGIVMIAQQEGMTNPRAEYTQTFTARCVDLFRRLKDEPTDTARPSD